MGGNDSEAPWRPEVQPYLDKLAEHLGERGIEEHSISVPVGRHRILLSPVEQRLVVDGVSDGDGPVRDSHLWMRDAAGLQIKTLRSLRLVEKVGAKERGAVLAALGLDQEWSFPLEHEMSVTLRRLREAGNLDEAECLGQCRKKLREVMNVAAEVCEAAAREERERAKNRRFVYDWNEATGDARSRPRVREVSRGPLPIETGPGRQRRVMIGLAALAVMLVAMLVNLWFQRPRQLRSFSAQDFDGDAGIELVVNRSPVLLVIVTEATWEGLDEDAKVRAVESVGATVRDAGYQRVEFRTGSQPGLALWTRDGTIRVWR